MAYTDIHDLDGLAVESKDIDAIVAFLAAAQPAAYEWVASPAYLDLTLRKPA